MWIISASALDPGKTTTVARIVELAQLGAEANLAAANGPLAERDHQIKALDTKITQLERELNQGGEYIVRSYPPEYKRIDIGDFYADSSKFTRTTGWTPTVPLREGLRRTLATS